MDFGVTRGLPGKTRQFFQTYPTRQPCVEMVVPVILSYLILTTHSGGLAYVLADIRNTVRWAGLI